MALHQALAAFGISGLAGRHEPERTLNPDTLSAVGGSPQEQQKLSAQEVTLNPNKLTLAVDFRRKREGALARGSPLTRNGLGVSGLEFIRPLVLWEKVWRLTAPLRINAGSGCTGCRIQGIGSFSWSCIRIPKCFGSTSQMPERPCEVSFCFPQLRRSSVKQRTKQMLLP